MKKRIEITLEVEKEMFVIKDVKSDPSASKLLMLKERKENE